MDQQKNPFADIGQMLQQFKVPGVDMGALLDARRKDIEALAEANRQAYEGVQAIARRQAEILQQAMSEWQQAAGSMAGKGFGANAAAQQTELAKTAFEKALANMREMAELATKSQTQAFETVNKRFQENLADLRKLMQPK